MNESNKPMTAPYHLAEQVAVITGAAQGLGLAITQKLASCGASVVIGDLQEEKGQAAADSLRQKGFSADAGKLDVADSASVDRFFKNAHTKAGRLDILVTCAGVGQTVTPTVDLPDKEWQRVIDITLTGVFYCCRSAGRIMEKQERGSIVNLASINGQNPAALVMAYNVAKAGVISMTRSLALELAAYGIRANAVSPGPVYTDFNRTLMAQRCKSLNITENQMIEKIRAAVPLGRWGKPADIANAVAFLCSDEASWMTGEIVRVSGGLEGVSAAPPKR